MGEGGGATPHQRYIALFSRSFIVNHILVKFGDN